MNTLVACSGSAHRKYRRQQSIPNFLLAYGLFDVLRELKYFQFSIPISLLVFYSNLFYVFFPAKSRIHREKILDNVGDDEEEEKKLTNK